MKPTHRLIVCSIVVCFVFAGHALGQCEGRATAMTTETRHSDCFNPENALQWNFNIICLDACGKVWYTPPAQPGSADGACDFLVRDFCHPRYYRKDHANGM